MNPLWEENGRIDRLKKLWAEGLSGLKIAEDLGPGFTVSMVFHMAGKLRLPKRGWGNQSSQKQAARDRTALRRANAGNAFVNGGKAQSILSGIEKRVDAQTKAPMRLPASFLTAPPDAVDLMHLDNGTAMCRWPVGEGKPQLFCGHPTLEGKSYCAEHNALAWGFGTDSERTAHRVLKREAMHA